MYPGRTNENAPESGASTSQAPNFFLANANVITSQQKNVNVPFPLYM
jgi:hypothetical protein